MLSSPFCLVKFRVRSQTRRDEKRLRPHHAGAKPELRGTTLLQHRLRCALGCSVSGAPGGFHCQRNAFSAYSGGRSKRLQYARLAAVDALSGELLGIAFSVNVRSLLYRFNRFCARPVCMFFEARQRNFQGRVSPRTSQAMAYAEDRFQIESRYRVEHRGVSSRASTALGQLGSDSPLGCHSLHR